MLDAAANDDKKGYDPTGTTANEDSAFLDMVFKMLIAELNGLDKNYGRIIELLADGFEKREILDQINLEKGKTQGYAFISKAQKLAKDLYEKNYK